MPRTRKDISYLHSSNFCRSGNDMMYIHSYIGICCTKYLNQIFNLAPSPLYSSAHHFNPSSAHHSHLFFPHKSPLPFPSVSSLLHPQILRSNPLPDLILSRNAPPYALPKTMKCEMRRLLGKRGGKVQIRGIYPWTGCDDGDDDDDDDDEKKCVIVESVSCGWVGMGWDEMDWVGLVYGIWGLGWMVLFDMRECVILFPDGRRIDIILSNVNRFHFGKNPPT